MITGYFATCKFSDERLSAHGKVQGKSLTSMMSRFKSDARVSMATEGQQQRVIKKRKQDDVTVTGLYSSSDPTLVMAHNNTHVTHSLFKAPLRCILAFL